MRKKWRLGWIGLLAMCLSPAWGQNAAGSARASGQAAAKAKNSKGKKHRQKPRRADTLDFWQGWKGLGSLGYNLSTGDTQSLNLTANLDAERRSGPPKHPDWTTHADVIALWAHSSNASGAVIRSDTFTGSLRQDYHLNTRQFVYAMAQLEHIQPESIALRQSYGGGVGQRLLFTPRAQWNALLGVDWTRTSFTPTAGLPAGTALLRNAAEAQVGETLKIKLANHLRLAHEFSYFKSLNQAGARFETSSILAVPISRHFNISFNFDDYYLTQPLPGHHANNATLSAGLGVKF